MKILVISGSPKMKGNTARVLSMFEDRVKEPHTIEIINISKYKIGGCIGCYRCQEYKNEPGCVLKDDAQDIFDKLIHADAIVYATPLYCWSFTAQIKPLIDRHYCLVTGFGTPDHDSLIVNKPAALLVTCMGPVEGNCDPIQQIFMGFSDYTRLQSKGIFILPFCSIPDEIGANGQELAEKLANAILSN